MLSKRVMLREFQELQQVNTGGTTTHQHVCNRGQIHNKWGQCVTHHHIVAMKRRKLLAAAAAAPLVLVSGLEMALLSTPGGETVLLSASGLERAPLPAAHQQLQALECQHNSRTPLQTSHRTQAHNTSHRNCSLPCIEHTSLWLPIRPPAFS